MLTRARRGRLRRLGVVERAGQCVCSRIEDGVVGHGDELEDVGERHWRFLVGAAGMAASVEFGVGLTLQSIGSSCRVGMKVSIS